MDLGDNSMEADDLVDLDRNIQNYDNYMVGLKRIRDLSNVLNELGPLHQNLGQLSFQHP